MAYLIPFLLSLAFLFAVFTTFNAYQNLSPENHLLKGHALTEVQNPTSLPNSPIQVSVSSPNDHTTQKSQADSNPNLLRELEQSSTPVFKRRTVVIRVNARDNDSDDDDSGDTADTDNDTDSGPDSERGLTSGSGSGGSGSNSGSGGGGGSSGSSSGSGSSGGSGSSNSGPSPNSGPNSNSAPDEDTDTDTDAGTQIIIVDDSDEEDAEDEEASDDVYLIDLTDYTDNEDLVVVVESNQTQTVPPALTGDEEPIVVPVDGLNIASWWMFEDQELGFEDWADLEAYLLSEYGTTFPTGINTTPGSLPFDSQISILSGQTGEVESVVDIQGTTEQQNLEVEDPILALTTSVTSCSQIVTCQRIYIRLVGYRNVCKNQLICPNAETEFGLGLEGEFIELEGEVRFFQEI